MASPAPLATIGVNRMLEIGRFIALAINWISSVPAATTTISARPAAGHLGIFFEYPHPVPGILETEENLPLPQLLASLAMHFDA